MIAPCDIRILPFASQISQRTVAPLHNLALKAEVALCVRGVLSPILANVYLHYVLDLWFHRKWRPGRAEGDAVIVRYADDVVVGFWISCDRNPPAVVILTESAGDAAAERLALSDPRVVRLRPSGAKDWNDMLRRQ